ncbi:SDR family oxidoreductase [Pedobacter sp. AW31-3R]|uniref:SDR family oxidoreductase n=1 Tax=Pedobacter sp. AW31-3R TaxID=3445781 RepID=UPI003FA0987C
MNAIVTGATKGIGKAIAVKLAEAGYNLAICARNEQDLAAMAAELEYTKVQVFYRATDCSDKEQVYRFCEESRREMDHVDVLVNNAGTFLPGALLDEEDERFELQQQLNLNAVYYMSKYFGKMMRKQQYGHIFTLCSVASKEYIENAGSYAVTKSALLSLNTVLRKELSIFNVKVTAILPGPTLTASWEGTAIPAERFVQPEDIASTLVTVLNLSSGANVEEIIIRPLVF